jgi:O-antigen/teichoic acid export membrane protein
MTKVVVRDRSKAGLYVGNALYIQLVFALVCFLLCYGLTYGLSRLLAEQEKFTPQIRLVIAIVFAAESLKSFNLTIRLACKALGKFKYDSIAVLLERGFLVLAGGYVLISGYGIYAASLVLLTARLIGFVFLLAVMSRLDRATLNKPDLAVCRFLLRESWFYVMQSAVWRIYDHIDVVMIYLIRNEKEVGWYGAARKIFEGLWLIPNILTEAVYPELSARHLVSRELVFKLFNKSFKYMLTVSMLVTIGTVIIAPPLIRVVFTPEYRNATVVLMLFGVAVLPSYLRYLFGTTLIAINQQKKEMWMAATRSVVNVTANLALIPFYGYIGATIATVLTEYAALIPYCVILRKEGLIRRSQLAFLYKPFLAVILLVPVYLLIRSWAAIAVFAVLTSGYMIITVWVLRIFEPDELVVIRRYAGTILKRLSGRSQV